MYINFRNTLQMFLFADFSQQYIWIWYSIGFKNLTINERSLSVCLSFDYLDNHSSDRLHT